MALTGFLGKKVGMTQITHPESGAMTPVTVIATPPCVVTQIRTQEKDGYTAIQLGAFTAKHATKAEIGHLKKSGVEKPFRYLREIRGVVDGFSTGQSISITDVFGAGDLIHVSGTSIGKGFAGTVKRHHFSRGPMAHGSKFHRLPGSSGAGTTPGRVLPGTRRAGHMGAERATVQNLEVVEINAEDGYMLVRGAVPGPDDTLLILQKSKRKRHIAIHAEKKDEKKKEKKEKDEAAAKKK